MPIAEIIGEIDAYLARLRQARELLLDQSREAPQKSVLRGKRKEARKEAGPTSSRTRRTKNHTSPSNHIEADPNRGAERVEFSVDLPTAAMAQVSRLEQSVIAQPEREMPHGVVVKRLPSKGPNALIRSVRHRGPKSLAGTRPDPAKPAIALAGPAGPKIIVVSAEQVRRERDRAAIAEVRRTREPASGLTGKLAFDALFK
jgi:hypothetical protein